MLGELTGRNPKSLIRMLGPKGNPTAKNLFNILGELREQEGVEFEAHAKFA
jgi:hypothetical protein